MGFLINFAGLNVVSKKRFESVVKWTPLWMSLYTVAVWNLTLLELEHHLPVSSNYGCHVHFSLFHQNPNV